MRSLRRAASLDQPRLSRANRVITFVEGVTLRAGKGAGGLFRLRPWQKTIVKGIYATGKDGRRLVSEALISMGRKGGKTELAAALAACHLYGPEAVPGGEVYSAAADRNMAGRIFRELEHFVFSDPAAEARINVKRFEKTLEVLDGPGKGSIYQALSSDATKAHSLSPSFVVCDELAQWRGREMFENLRTGTGAHESPLFLVISTMSADVHSVMSEVVAYGRSVLSGETNDPSFYTCIYEVPVASDPEEHARQMTDPAIWRLANPALGDFLRLDAFEKDAREAVRIPARESAFRNLRLNQPTELDERFIAYPDWQACAGSVDPDKLKGRPCWAGLDLSSTVDLTALMLFFPYDGGRVLPFFWAPAERIDEREDKDRVPYRLWASQGLLATTPGRAIDRRAISRQLARIAASYDLRGVGYDRFRMEDLLSTLNDEGIQMPLEAFGQGYASMAPAVDALERVVLDRNLIHGSHPCLTWNIANCRVTMDPAGNRKLDKARAPERIDGAIALAMAVGLHAKAPPW